METSVRFIPTQSTMLQVNGGMHNIQTHKKPALCFRGKKHALGIINDEDSIHTIQLTLKDHDHCPLVPFAGAEYPVDQFLTHLERIMRVKSISQEALKLIRQYPNVPDDFEELKKTPAPKLNGSHPSHRKTVANCIPSLATEFKTVPQKIRKFLRSQGLHAPYDDEQAIRRIMAGFKT